MTNSPCSLNDGVLVISILYLSIDMKYQWEEFVHCHWPVYWWLLISYFFVLAFRLTYIVGSMLSSVGSGDFLLNLRHKDTLPQLLMSCTWLFVLPLFAVWTGLGTFWLLQSKRLSAECLPMGMPLCFIIMWQLLSYAWIILHFTLGGFAWLMEYRLRNTERSLRALEDNETLARWGRVSEISGYTDLVNGSLGGLTPEQIKKLPEVSAEALELGEDSECSICLNCVCSHDSVRQLPCGHTFHRSCIDLWLLRRAECPLCKQSVRIKEEHWHNQPAIATEEWHI